MVGDTGGKGGGGAPDLYSRALCIIVYLGNQEYENQGIYN